MNLSLKIQHFAQKLQLQFLKLRIEISQSMKTFSAPLFILNLTAFINFFPFQALHSMFNFPTWIDLLLDAFLVIMCIQICSVVVSLIVLDTPKINQMIKKCDQLSLWLDRQSIGVHVKIPTRKKRSVNKI